MDTTVNGLDGPLQRATLPSGVELHYLQGGAGEPLIFVHGVMGDWQSWAPQWSAFCDRYRCTTYSRRYNHPNRNDMPSPSHSALIEAEDLAQFMTALGIARAVLVASSYGAFIALALAEQQPERVAAIVAVEPAMLCYAEFSATGRAALARFRQSVVEPANAAFRRGDDRLGAQLMTGGIHAGGALALDDAALAKRLRSARAMRMLALSSNEFPQLAPETLASLTCPVLLVSGLQTPAIHAEVFGNVRRAMPQAQVASIEGAGHPVPRDQPERFNATALAFLDTARMGQSTGRTA
ncbi:alpha/beta hydrolase [Sphaerotilus sp.]|uniref:alpha/beta fold hydrolase n=1 Tax=Sphaerotilus sp. TaxID=2093942 RepID=UPI002ACE07C0|nr:alpha/beta hydrolase [Sphaerotilus sp.]MDZ7856994.1 alpha/beta hydrolase [Sphaerotilus sp.]